MFRAAGNLCQSWEVHQCEIVVDALDLERVAG